ncbi:Crp/Fnr family transcriptional regulator [Wenyingzhuangia sp. 1_MG-2023]|nr:Crp/Fnr family transcriptional regulator [Wenyingzhuangia sp. 1_MG-2023]
MSYHQLKTHILKHVQITDEEFKLYQKYFKIQQVDKRQFLLKQGEYCLFEAFVCKGCFRVFTTDEDGKEHTVYFALEDWWIVDLDSLVNKVTSKLSIQALESSEVLIIHKSDKEKLYKESPKAEQLFRKMSQKAIISFQRRIVRNLSLKAEERYLDFLDNYSNIVPRITNIQLASYLGISHELVSKFRKKAIKKK